MLAIADEKGLINWDFGAIDGSFSRWERQQVYFDAFIDLATIHIWIQRILLVG